MNKQLIDAILRLLEIYPDCETCKSQNYACLPSQWVQGYKRCDKTRPWNTPGTIGDDNTIVTGPVGSGGPGGAGSGGGSSCVGTNEANAKIFSHQNEMNRILNQELDHLNDTRAKQKTELDTEARLILLNENRKKRNLQWIYVICIWIVCLILVLLIVFFCSFLPSWLPCNILISIILGFAAVMTLYLYLEMNKKDPNDFDKLNLAPPDISFNSTYIPKNSGLDLSLNVCVGKDCCSALAGTVWDSGNTVCVREGFDTEWSNERVGVYLFNSVGLAIPNTAYEIGYNRYK